VVKTVAFAVPGDLTTPTGGYVYDRRIIAELPALGWTVDALDIGDGFPRPAQRTRMQAGQRLAALPRGQPIVIDGLAFGVLAEEARALRPSHPLIALVHHPLAFETGLGAGEAEVLRASERLALACAHRVVATSAATARLLGADYDVAADRLTVVRPGTDRAAPALRADGGVNGGAVSLLAVGAVVPRKGYDVLLAALATLKDCPWQLVIAGDRTRSPDTARRLDQDIARFDLAARVSVVGAVASERLAALYAAADLFVLPSRFEGYGMAYTEAIAHGVPVVATKAGAIPDTVPPGAGVLVPPDDAEALAATLRRLIENPTEREQLAAGARAVAASFPSWREQATLFAQVLDQATKQVQDGVA
jgi:glycosyltransferase involved in cell wall biosynthesis